MTITSIVKTQSDHNGYACMNIAAIPAISPIIPASPSINAANSSQPSSLSASWS